MGSFASKRQSNQVIQVTQIQETRLEVRGQHIDPQKKSPKHVVRHSTTTMSDADSDVDEAFNYVNNTHSWDYAGRVNVGEYRVMWGSHLGGVYRDVA